MKWRHQDAAGSQRTAQKEKENGSEMFEEVPLVLVSPCGAWRAHISGLDWTAMLLAALLERQLRGCSRALVRQKSQAHRHTHAPHIRAYRMLELVHNVRLCAFSFPLVRSCGVGWLAATATAIHSREIFLKTDD